MRIESFYSDKHLSYEELVEYNQGNLSNSEMHRLEQHLISCELCNDALEGVNLLGFESANSSLDKIKEATGAKESIEFGIYHYIGIAASVILIAVLGFIFTRNSDDATILAEEASEVIKESIADHSANETPNPIEAYSDSTEQFSDSLLIAMNDQNNEAISPSLSSAEPINEVTVQSTQSDTGMAQNIIMAEEEVAVADLNVASDSLIIGAEDSTVIAAAELENDADQLSGAKKARSAQAAPSEALNEFAAVEGQEYVAASPERGIRVYNRYLRRNLNYPTAAKANSIEGDVILQVVINSDGTVGDIIITTSLGYGCDEEAIRLVKEGAPWTPATRGGRAIQDEVSVTVSFK